MGVVFSPVRGGPHFHTKGSFSIPKSSIGGLFQSVMEYFQPLKKGVSILKKDSFSNSPKRECRSAPQGDMVGRDSVSIPRGPHSSQREIFSYSTRTVPQRMRFSASRGPIHSHNKVVHFTSLKGTLSIYLTTFPVRQGAISIPRGNFHSLKCDLFNHSRGYFSSPQCGFFDHSRDSFSQGDVLSVSKRPCPFVKGKLQFVGGKPIYHRTGPFSIISRGHFQLLQGTMSV